MFFERRRAGLFVPHVLHEPGVAQFLPACELALEGVVVAGRDLGAQHVELLLEVVERVQDRGRVELDDLAPHDRIAGRDSAGVAESARAAGVAQHFLARVLAAEDGERERGGHDVLHMAGVGDQVVVLLWIDADHVRLYRAPEPGDGLDVRFRGVRGGAQEDVRAAEHRGERMDVPGVFGAGHRVAADEHYAARDHGALRRVQDRALYAAHVRHDGAWPPKAGILGQIPDDDRERERQERDVGLRDDLRRVVRGEVRGVFGQRPFAGGRVARAAEAADARHVLQREPERCAEQAESDDRDIFHAGRVRHNG